MKNYFGLFLFLLSFSCFAKNTTSLLYLRAHVPVTHKLEIRMDKKGLHTSMKTNALKGYARPKFFVKKSPHTYIVSVVHP
jgi:hypothetical protein